VWALAQSRGSPATRKYTMVGKNILRGANERLGRKNIQNIINNNLENFKGARLLPGEAFATERY